MLIGPLFAPIRRALGHYLRVGLVLLIAFHAPWRLAVLAVEIACVSPGWVKTTQSDSLYWEAKNLQRRLELRGWLVQYLEGPPELYGMTQPDAHTVTINQSLHWNARYATLLHEGGHILGPSWLSTPQQEAFAESVAAIAGQDGLREHARYLSSIRGDAYLVLLTEWRNIYRAADQLTR